MPAPQGCTVLRSKDMGNKQSNYLRCDVTSGVNGPGRAVDECSRPWYMITFFAGHYLAMRGALSPPRTNKFQKLESTYSSSKIMPKYRAWKVQHMFFFLLFNSH